MYVAVLGTMEAEVVAEGAEEVVEVCAITVDMVDRRQNKMRFGRVCGFDRRRAGSIGGGCRIVITYILFR